ncbi:MAG: diguanylate cyclase [Acidimicrobiales bacterium]
MEPDDEALLVEAAEVALADRHAEDIVALHAIASLAPGEPDDRLSLLVEAGCAALDLDRGVVLLRSGTDLVVRVAAGPRSAQGCRPGTVIDDRRIADSLARQATVATLGGPAASEGQGPLGGGPLVTCPLWVTGCIAGAIAFTGAHHRSPFTSWQLSLVDLVADGAARVLERDADIRALVRLESQAQAMIAASPDAVARVRSDGHRLIAGSEQADGLFDPCSAVRPPGASIDTRTEEQVLVAITAALATGEVQTSVHTAGPGPRALQVEARYARSGPDEVVSIVRDVTDQRRAELALAEQAAFEALVASVSTNLISCTTGHLDDAIERGLGEVARFFDADVASIDELSPDGATLRVSHLWTGGDAGEVRRRGDRVDVAGFGWLSARFESGGHVFTRGADPVPPDVTGSASAYAGAPASSDDRGALWVRLGSGGEMAGVLSLAWRNHEPPETDDVFGLVRFAADAFHGAMRRRSMSLLADGQAEVFELIARGAPVATALLGARSLLARHTLGASVLVATVDDAGRLTLVCDPERFDQDDVATREDWSTWFAAVEADLSNPFGQAVVTGEPVLIGDVRSDPRFGDDALPPRRYRSATVLPVRSSRTGRTLAVVAMLGTETGAPVPRPAVRDSVLSLVTVATERSIDELRLAHQATHDPLTGVGNRAALLDRLDLVLARARRSNRAVGVLFCDLDAFKSVNDRYGHDRGDRLLVEVARRIAGAVRPSDTVCRTGGDEFVVVCEDLADPDQAHLIADRVRHAVESDAIEIGETAVEVTASVGVAVADLLLDDADRLLRTADLAMYATKQHRAALARERGIDLRHPAAAGILPRAEPSASDLAAAIDGDQLELVHQPIVGRDGSLAGVEVLAHWDHHELGPVEAERITGAAAGELAVALGRWTRRAALAERRRWIEAPGADADVPVHVNMGPGELTAPDVVEDILSDLDRTGVGTEALVIEVAERDLAAPAHRVAVARLSRAGLAVLVEGAGTGGMPLADLADLEVRGIKLGPSLVERLDGDGTVGLEVVRSLVLLAHGLGWRSLAVGVDADRQRATLLGFGIDAVQGRCVAVPVPLEGLQSWLATHRLG